MRKVKPEVYLIARPQVDYTGICRYLKSTGASKQTRENWDIEDGADAQNLVEFAGRLCYNSFEPGLNPNVTRIRGDQDAYLSNILSSQHGSVLEHANFTFVFQDVSRVMTHEVVRHRAGCAISQESLRYVRPRDIPFWFPDWAKEDTELMHHAEGMLQLMEEFHQWMTLHFGLDDEEVPFSVKKHRTSFMRRFLPDGIATAMTWTANVRTLRHVLEVRTAPGAEEEIRLVFDQVAKLMIQECPALFQDFQRGGDGSWIPEHRKV